MVVERGDRPRPIRTPVALERLMQALSEPQGQTGSPEQRPELQDLPLGTRVVLDMIGAITEPRAHRLFFDNLFTSRASTAG